MFALHLSRHGKPLLAVVPFYGEQHIGKEHMMSEEKRALTLEDFWRLKTVDDPQPSPDGTQVAYVVGSFDEAKNQAHSAIWLASLEDGRCHQLTSGESQDMQPRWSLMARD